ncbi:hypothetical protein BIV24_27830 [Streptomyces colonosanans]|uniref:Transposase n=1 Tax=Streptomyces colonosanans TaxID=1428652 RepID=A0A1S2NWY7_9ACTN|nr:hypothetical protein BIV24_27830 [Streptomyces colonosanans]
MADRLREKATVRAIAAELGRELARALRTRRKPHRQAACRQPRFATAMVMISTRPEEDRRCPVTGRVT